MEHDERFGCGAVFAAVCLVIFAVLISEQMTPKTKVVDVPVTIVNVHRDGFAFRKVVTVVEFADGSRRRYPGKLGKKGEKILVPITVKEK